MFGKGALIMVMGAVIIFSLYQLKLNRSVLSTTDNFNRQFTKTSISLKRSKREILRRVYSIVWF